MSSKTQTVSSDASNIDWYSVFKHAYKHSTNFESGDKLPPGNLVQSLQAVGEVNSINSAGKIIQKAKNSGDLKWENGKFEVSITAPITKDIRLSLKQKLRELIRNGESGVIQSPTSSGKTYIPSTTKWGNLAHITNDKPVMMFSPTKKARDEAIAKTVKSDAKAAILKGREDTCPLPRGEYDRENDTGNSSIKAPDGSDPSDWFKRMCDDMGLPFSVAHTLFEEAHNGDLPCGNNGECRASTQWNGIPRNDEDNINYDILHATHQFARVPQLINDSILIFDEQPDFSLNLSTGRVRKMVSSYLEEINAPVSSWEDLIVAVTSDFEMNLNSSRDTLKMPDPDWFQTEPKAHALAPGIVEAILAAEERQHNRWVGTSNYTFPTLNPKHNGPDQKLTLRIVIEGDNYDVRKLQAIPDFTKAHSVIGLDAHPTMVKWQSFTLPNIEKIQIIEDEKLQEWRQNERKLNIIQVGDNKNTWTKKGFSQSKVRVLAQNLRRKYNKGFRTGITSKRFKQNLLKELNDAGVENPETIHYGKEKSVNSFELEEAGIVAGCISPSDDDIKDWMALLGKSAKPAREIDGSDKDGQIWIGNDDNVAHELIRDVRERKVLQACGRYARSPQDPNDYADVFVLTNVLPTNYIDQTFDDVSVFGKKEKQILQYISETNGEASPNEIAKNTSASRKWVHKTLNMCRDETWLKIRDTEGHNNPELFNANQCPDGIVDV